MRRFFPSSYALIILAALAIALRFFIYINADSAGLLYEAVRINSGEVLNKDFIEINPPLIIYMMLLPVYLQHLNGLALPVVFNLCVAAVALLSLALTLPRLLNNWLKIAVVFLLLMPFGNIWGEREHLYIVLVWPYFISLLDARPVSLKYKIISGLMAGFGFCIKPYFMLLWLGLMLAKTIIEKRQSFFTLQNLLIGLCTVAYLVFLIGFEKRYVNDVVPYLLQHYTLFKSLDTLKMIALNIVICQSAFWLLFSYDRQAITRPIYLAICANILSLLIIGLQGRIFPYYFYPSLFFGFLANILILTVTSRDKAEHGLAVFTAKIIIIAYMGLVLVTTMDRENIIAADNDTGTMVEIYNKHAANQPVYFIGTAFGPVYFPALLYSTALTKPYYGTMWPLPSIVKSENVQGAEFTNQVVADLKANPPAVIVVSKPYTEYVWDDQPGFDYIKYLAQNDAFRETWADYQLLTELKDYDVYVKQVR